MKTTLNQLAKEIIEQNEYMTIGSSDEKGNPWVSPVAYSYDRWHFYFLSIPSSLHCQNITKNSKVTIAIFDSRQLWGKGVGLQIEGIVKKVEVLNYPLVMKNYFTRQYPYGNITNTLSLGLKKLIRRKIYQFYRFTPIKVWMNNPNAEIDERIEIDLE